MKKVQLLYITLLSIFSILFMIPTHAFTEDNVITDRIIQNKPYRLYEYYDNIVGRYVYTILDGWNYLATRTENGQSLTFTRFGFENVGPNKYKIYDYDIRSEYKYFNVSKRGYLYLDRQRNAQVFDISKRGNRYRINHVNGNRNEPLGIYYYGKIFYVTSFNQSSPDPNKQDWYLWRLGNG